MYAGMKVNWHEVLMPKTSAASSDDSLPLFLCVFSSDKGTEKITEYTQEDWEACTEAMQTSLDMVSL